MAIKNIPQGEKHYCAKLTNNDVLRIKEGLRLNYKQATLAQWFNVSWCTIHDIKIGRTWKHVK